MATPNVDKGLAAGSAALEVLTPEDIEVEIEADPASTTVELPDGGLEITFAEEDEGVDDGFDANMAETLDEGVLQMLGDQLSEDVADDIRAREDWEKTYKEGLKLLGLNTEERTEPWDGACGVNHPMITEAVVRFQSETIMETFPAGGPVLTKVVGKETREKMGAALRVRADMNNEITERMPEFRDEHERMLFNLPSVGCAFKKVYHDDTKGRRLSMFIAAEDMVLPYGSTNVRTAPRATQVMRMSRNEIEALQEVGFYRDVDPGEAGRELNDIKQAKDKQTGFDDINDERFTVLESHVELYIEQDKLRGKTRRQIARPYILTVIKDTRVVLGLRRNWKENDSKYRRRQHFVQYDYIPGMGPYGLGLFHLIGGYAKSATSILRQLVDAGTLSNIPGGLKSKGMRVKNDDTPISPGEWRDVDVGSGTIKDNVLPLPYKEPSVVLAGLLEKIIEEGRRLPGMADMKIADMSSQAPVGTTLALIERQLKVMSAVQARTHASLKQEFQLIKELVVEHDGDKEYGYEPEVGERSSRAADYAMVEVVPVSDPNAATMTHRLVQYQAVIQLSQTAPQIYNLPLLHRGMLEVLGVKNAEKLVPLPEDAKPTDPVTENMNVLKGVPVKAFIHQDHKAHMAVHQMAMQDPLLMQTIGQNPQAQAMMAAAQAHIAEHMGFLYRQQVEERLGFPLPAVEEQLPPEVEVAISQLMAEAAGMVLQNNQAQAAQQQAAQQEADPVFQLQKREQDRKERETTVKEQLAQAKIAKDADDVRIREQQMQINAAAQVDKQNLAERKQTADEEIDEQNVAVSAAKVGVMGRAQDQTILQGDRDTALKAYDTIQKYNARNTLGESRGAGGKGEKK